MSNWQRVCGCVAAAGVLAARSSGVVAAQDGDTAVAPQIEQIIVTAQRREQNLQDVGITVNAFSGEQLRRMGVESSLDVARVTPGVHISGSNAGQSANFTIRGVTQSDYADVIEAPVAVYVDDEYVANLQGQSFGLFDVERVEVLKGPQGTLFGRNATGGLVHYVIEKPTSRPEANVDLTYGAYNQTTVEAALSGPLSERFSARISGYYNKFDPVMDNVYPQGLAEGYPANFGPPVSPCCEDEWAEETLGGRAQLQYATDNLTVRLAATTINHDLSTAPYNIVPVVPVVDEQGRLVNAVYAGPNETRVAIGPDGENYLGLPNSPPSRLPGRDWLGFLPPDGDRLVVSKEFAREDHNSTSSSDVGLHIDYDFGPVQLTSITAYSEFKKRIYIDGEGGPVNFLDVGQLGDTDTVSQELRLASSEGGFRWTAGLYLLQIDARGRDGLLAPSGSLFAALFGLAETGVDFPSLVELDTDSYSAFGQFEYDFAPRWTLIVGGRVIDEHQDYDYRSYATANTDNYTLQTAPILFETQPRFTDKRSDTLWAGKLQVEFRPSDDLLIYLGANRGVKGGAYNAKIFDGGPPLPDSQIPYKPETLLSYEGGFKSTLAGGAATLNASLFYYDYSDYQGFTFQNISGYVQNADGHMYGGEAQLSMRPWSGAQLDLGLSLFSATIENLQIAPGVLRDVHPAYAPETQAFGAFSQQLGPEIFGGTVTLGVQGNYVSDFYHNIRNFDATKISGYSVFDARAAWRSRSGALELSAFVENIADKRYDTIGFEGSTVFGGNPIAYGKPRWWGVRASLNFGRD